jgi:hypothetical protein
LSCEQLDTVDKNMFGDAFRAVKAYICDPSHATAICIPDQINKSVTPRDGTEPITLDQIWLDEDTDEEIQDDEEKSSCTIC